MVDYRVRLTAAMLLLVAATLILIGVGSACVGYMVGEREGERRTVKGQVAIASALGADWEAHRSNAKQEYERTTDQLAADLANAATQLRAEISMYHGCGAICTVIAYQFAQQLVHAGDSIRKSEMPSLPEWKGVLARASASANSEMVGIATDVSPLNDARRGTVFSESSMRAAIALICGTVVLCFGIACFTLLKLQPATDDHDGGPMPRN